MHAQPSILCTAGAGRLSPRSALPEQQPRPQEQPAPTALTGAAHRDPVPPEPRLHRQLRRDRPYQPAPDSLICFGDRNSDAEMKSKFMLAMFSIEMPFGQWTSHSPWFVQWPKSLLSISVTILTTRS